MIAIELSHVLGLEDTMTRHGLRWLNNKLEHYTPTLVWEFYADYEATILRNLPKEKKPLE